MYTMIRSSEIGWGAEDRGPALSLKKKNLNTGELLCLHLTPKTSTLNQFSSNIFKGLERQHY